MPKRKIYFFSNGVTIVSDKPGEYREPPEPMRALFDGTQCAFQVPWIRVFADFLQSVGENPWDFELHFPDGRTGWIFWNDDPDTLFDDSSGEWSWKITDPPPPAASEAQQ